MLIKTRFKGLLLIKNKKFKLDYLLDLLKRNRFKNSIFRHNEINKHSYRISGNIYATKV